MSNDTATTTQPAEQKGRFAWVIDVIEIILFVGYFALGWRAFSSFFSSFDLESFFDNIMAAVWFLIIGAVIQTILCFLTAFKSKGNMRVAVWNLVWIGFNLWGILTF